MATDGFTQHCRDIIRALSYEDILACTVYVPPLLFMAGPVSLRYPFFPNRPLIPNDSDGSDEPLCRPKRPA